MKQILKITFIFSLLMLVVQSCREDNYRDWETAEPSFKLYDSSLGNIVLYPTMKDNPFTLNWENTRSASGEYTIVFSTTEDFANPITYGTSTSSSYTSSIEDLNMALLQAGYAPYASTIVHFRIQDSADPSVFSNAIAFSVTPYPVDKPVITSPSAGAALALNSQTPIATVSTVTWTDYATYGVAVNYLIEVALHNGTTWKEAGSTTDLKTFDWTHKTLNDAVLAAGALADVASDIDVRVTATTQSTGGTISNVSDIVTINVTPYPAFRNLYLVGDATAPGWNPDNGNPAIYRDPANVNQFTYTGYFAAGSFKLLEVLGQWQPQWGQNAGVVAVNPGGGSDPGVFSIPTAGYYTFNIDISGGTYAVNSYTGSTTTTYASMGIIGSATPLGWGGDTVMTQSTFDPHQWSVTGVTLAVGEVKFRANGGWTDNWGASTEWSGQAVGNGPNIPVNTAGTYNVYFNDLDGRYVLVKQ